MSYALEINNLRKIFNEGKDNELLALDNINLRIEKGDFHAILGANGAGKSTTINIITGILNKTSGSVKVLGKEFEDNISDCKNELGTVPQEFNFAIFEKVEDIIYTQAGYYGLSRDEVREKVEDNMKSLGLWEKRKEQAKNLSGGMKRRLMIARALVHTPKIFILDEPTAGVDIELRNSMYDFLKKLNEGGMTIILTTHYLEEAQKLCKNMTLIKKGNVLESGNLKEILDKNKFEKLEDYYISKTKN
jgi:ABC-2 type transport system ATP-binding protein